MKKILFSLFFLFAFTFAQAQFTKPVGAVPIPTYSFLRTPTDSTITIYMGTINLYNTLVSKFDSVKVKGYATNYKLSKYKLKNDSINAKSGYATLWKLSHKLDSLLSILKYKNDSVNNSGYFTNYKALQYRKLNNHDSLSTLDEKSYNSLTDKPDLTVYKLKSDTVDLVGYFTNYKALSKVPTSRTINGYPLTSDITINTSPQGVSSNYIFCDDVIFPGTTPVWHEIEKQSDGGVAGSHTATGTSYSEMDRYVTAALNTTTIPGGLWYFSLFANTTAHTGQLKAEIYRVNSSGAIVGGVLGTAETLQFSNTVTASQEAKIYISEQTGWALTDRIGVVISGKRYTGTATVTFYHNIASGWVSEMSTPLTLLHNQLAGLNLGDYRHITATQADSTNSKGLQSKYAVSLKKDKSDSTNADGYTRRDRLATELAKKINLTQKGAANGVAELDAGAKVPFSQLPAALMIYKGTWSPATNTPSLSDAVGIAGWVYKCSVGGSVNLGSGSITFLTGDFVIYNGTIWERSVGTDNVVSVNGQQGIVSLSTDNVSEGSTNKYYTDARARGAVSLTTNNASGSATYNSTTGVFNIPTYTLAGLGGEPANANIQSHIANTSNPHSVTIGQIGAAPSSGSANYIQNQNSAAQSANMWISGSGTFGGKITIATGGNQILSEVLRFNRTEDGNRYNSIYATSDGTSAAANNIAFYVHNLTSGTAQTEVLKLNGNNTITASSLASSVTHPIYADASGTLTNTAPTSGTIGYWQRSGTTLSPVNGGDNITAGRILSLTHGYNPYISLNVTDYGGMEWQLAGENNNLRIYNITQGTNPFSINRYTDAATFASTVSATNYYATSLTSGYLPYVNSSKLLANSPVWTDGNGSVGIGTTGPNNKLVVQTSGNSQGISIQNDATTGDVRRNIQFQNSTNSLAEITHYSGTYGPKLGIRTFESDAFITFGAGVGSESVRILPSGSVLIGYTSSQTSGSAKLEVNGNGYFNGNVGIGTTSPWSKVVIKSSTNNTQFALEQNNADAGTSFFVDSTTGDLRIGRYSSAGTVNTEQLRITNNNGSLLVGYTSSQTSGTAKLEVNGGAYFNGNVGIGTTTPGAKLHVSGSASTDWIRIQSTAAGVNGTLDMYTSGTGGFIPGTTGFNTSAATAPIVFAVNSSEVMRVTNGNVGIGTTSPAYKLSVSGAGAVRNEIIGTDAGSTAGLFLRSNANSGGTTIRDNNKDLEIFTSTTGQVVTIKDNGSVFVGYTSDPTSGNKFAVNGNGYFGGSISAWGGNIALVGTDVNGTLNINNNSSEFAIRGNLTGKNLYLATGNRTADIAIAGSSGAVTLSSLSGSGNRLVYVNSSGTLAASYTLPNSDGSNSQVLTTNGGGVLSWTDKGGGTSGGITSINSQTGATQSIVGTAPVTVSSSSNTHTISMAAATTSVNGYLSSTDWNTFNGKQAALNGTGFVKASGTTISYDNSTYLTSATVPNTHTLNEHEDVSTGSPSSGQVLTWQGSYWGVSTPVGFPGSGVALSTGSAWGTSLGYGTASTANYLAQRDGSGNLTAANFCISSDIRLKTNIADISTDWINKVHFVQFNMKSDLNRQRYGVIAQELEKIAPQLVNEDSNGIKSVNYIDLLIAKIVELEKRIEILEKR